MAEDERDQPDWIEAERLKLLTAITNELGRKREEAEIAAEEAGQPYAFTREEARRLRALNWNPR